MFLKVYLLYIVCNLFLRNSILSLRVLKVNKKHICKDIFLSIYDGSNQDLRVVEFDETNNSIDHNVNDKNDVEGGRKSPKRMMSWPFNRFESPSLLTGEFAADCGFDPLNIVKSNDQLFTLREAEIKHARLAMLGF